MFGLFKPKLDKNVQASLDIFNKRQNIIKSIFDGTNMLNIELVADELKESTDSLSMVLSPSFPVINNPYSNNEEMYKFAVWFLTNERTHVENRSGLRESSYNKRIKDIEELKDATEFIRNNKIPKNFKVQKPDFNPFDFNVLMHNEYKDEIIVFAVMRILSNFNVWPTNGNEQDLIEKIPYLLYISILSLESFDDYRNIARL